YRLAHWARKQVWKVWHPYLSGVCVLALDEAGRVLLVRHSYGYRCWVPPGGGMAGGEESVSTAVRELGEETGCILTGARQVAVVDQDLHGARNRVHIVAGRANGPAVPDLREIVDARFFDLDALPDDMRSGLPESVREWVQAYRDEAVSQ
ncbi:MAG: NUDIX domain-containing protein, partial [Novosphingobium sp.]